VTTIQFGAWTKYIVSGVKPSNIYKYTNHNTFNTRLLS